MEHQEESLQQRQENELQVLQAVFLDDVQDLRSSAWKVPQPLEVIITLYPQQSAGGDGKFNCQIDLEVKCSHLYPTVIPNFTLKNSKGVSVQKLKELQEEIAELAVNLRGEVMILEIAQHVQVWLHKQNEAPRYPSFYEEMISNQRKKEEEKELLRMQQVEWEKQEAEIKRKAIEEEILRRQEAIIIESRTRREQSPANVMQSYIEERRSSIGNSDKSKKNPTLSPFAMGRRRRLSARTESNSSQDSCDHVGITSIKFKDRKVKKGRCLGHGRRGSIVYNALDVKSGELMIIIEWMLNLPQSKLMDLEEKELGNSLKQIAIIEQEFNSLLRLRHKNLVHYLGMNHFRIGTNYIIQILQEFVPGNSLSFHLTENVPVSCEFLQFYVIGILEGLSYLHNNSIVHRDLRDTSIFLDRGIVRIADYSLDKRLSELWSIVNKEGFEEAFPPSVGRGGKKADIFRLGIVCLSLLKGEIVETMFPEMPKNLPPLILDFLKRCMNINEQERWSADRLLEHPFLKPSSKNEISPPLKQPSYQIEEKIEPEPEVPIVVAQDPSGKSRMVNEFSVLKWLGRGAFGDVYKVQNKLDGGVYAIKCIQLKSHNQQINRKIMREVKLLSRLNHENVVRYFNSWLELGSMNKDSIKSDTDASYTSKVSQDESNMSVGLSMTDNVEKVQETTFDKSSKCNWKGSFLTDDNESSSSEDEYNFGNTFLSRMDSSSHIVFASMNESTVQSEQTFNAADNIQRQSGNKKNDEQSTDKLVQFMYIQMEFCDKNTLRDAIDDGLYLDENRVWRLFREIIEGLSHIHEQGMIHRDLKPVNIFLDIQDHVKIGDFGLATKSSLTDLTPSFNAVSGANEGDGIRSDDGSLTGWVGTRFYISPEVANCKLRVTYSQKVDIYSLGIIFFEMCYRNMATFMEKSKILENLRSPDVILPIDFNESKNSQQVAIIKWLLNHDPDKRPSSLELLQSSYLPPLQIEEAELHEMLRTTVSNPQSKAFKYLISTLFQQDTSTAANVTYDMITKNKASFNRNNCVAFKFITDSIIKVFHKHGAVQVATPLIMPKTILHENNEFCVKLVDHSGGVVTLPTDLRIPFCRFLVINNISSLKRYFISSAYRERKVFGCHPRELYECAFDIVTPSPGNLIADVEVLSVVWEIVQEFPSISDCRSFVHVNHVSLLKGILLHCGIPEEIHQQFFATLNNVENLGRIHVHTRLSALGISEHCIDNFCRMIEVQGPISKIKNLLKPIVKRRGRESSLIKQGLSDLDTIISNAQAMGLPTSIIVTPNLVYKIDHFSSMLFQFVCELKKKRRKVGMEVIAAGGRYDKLIAAIKRSFVDVTEGQEVGQSGVGFSIAVEKLVSAILESDDYQNPNIFDVYVCSSGDRPLIKEKAGVVRKLWNSGISAHIQYDSNQSLEEIRDYCKDFHAYAVIIKDTELETIRIICWDKDRFLEKKVQSSEMIDYLLQRGLGKLEFGESSPSALKLENSRLERSSSESGLGSCHYNIAFLTTEKMAPNLRRRHEGQIMSQLNHVIQRFSPKCSVEVLVVELNSSVLKTLNTHLELDGNDEKLQNGMEQVILKHQRHRKYLDKLCEQLSKFISEKQKPIVILYGLNDSSYQVFL